MNSYVVAERAVVGGLAALLLIGSLIGLVVAIIMIVSLWKIFKKAGMEGWESIIPGYNLAILCKITGFTPYLAFLLLGNFIPVIKIITSIALIVLYIAIDIYLARAFGKEDIYVVGLVLLPVIFYPLLAFDKEAKYNNTYMYKGVGLCNYMNGNAANNNNNTFYAENVNSTQETQSDAQEDVVKESNPVEPTPTETNVDPIQNKDNDNNINSL